MRKILQKIESFEFKNFEFIAIEIARAKLEPISLYQAALKCSLLDVNKR